MNQRELSWLSISLGINRVEEEEWGSHATDKLLA